MGEHADVDFGKSADDYRKHRAGFPPELIERLKAFGVGRPKQRVLDLGTGTGTLARQFAKAGCAVTALDISQAMITQAQELDRESGVSVAYHVGRAEELPFSDEKFDLIIAGQCWHWFKRDAAAQSVRAHLKDNGSLVICHFDWIPLDDNVVAVTEQLILKHNPAWAFANGVGMYPAWLSDVARAGFERRETFSFDLNVPYSPDDWVGRIRASAGVGASLPPDQVKAFDADLRQVLAERFPEKVLAVPHRVWSLVAGLS
ncbi:MAG: methyltransferase domain-containing protein [Rhodospirillaceae bacterium]